MYRTLSHPLPERQLRVVALLRRSWRNVFIPQAHAHSNLQHKNKSFTEAQYERDFKAFGTLAALLGMCDRYETFWLWKVPSHRKTVLNAC